MSRKVEPSSFRDLSGFVFCEDNRIFRQINVGYKANYDHLMNSGLYSELAEKSLLISHREVDPEMAPVPPAYKILQPEAVPVISYPYEWCFSALRDAALCTLTIQETALNHDMSLKDASAYNIQFLRGKPVFVDTLSFERYREGAPWIAYGQFCRHFLAPLALMAYKDIRLQQLLRIHLDGIPLDLTAKLLPLRSRVNLSIFSHIHAHAASQRHFSRPQKDRREYSLSKFKLRAIVDDLKSCIAKIGIPREKSEWGEYYGKTNYSREAMRHKQEIAATLLDRIQPESIIDLGGNTGLFSRIPGNSTVPVILLDIDPATVDDRYRAARTNGDGHVLPLILDVTNPSPAIGWCNEERKSAFERFKADTVLALAFIHHLAITNNTPLQKIAAFFNHICRRLIIEWVPIEDSQIKRMLASRENIFSDYTRERFETAFGEHFTILDQTPVKDSLRVIYLMEKK
jgi:hypothetical protein